MYLWDPGKRAENLRKHGVDFAAVEDFLWRTAVVEEDRDVTGEQRWRAIGWIGMRLYFLVYADAVVEVEGPDGTRETVQATRVISLRFADKKEARHYVQETAPR